MLNGSPSSPLVPDAAVDRPRRDRAGVEGDARRQVEPAVVPGPVRPRHHPAAVRVEDDVHALGLREVTPQVDRLAVGPFTHLAEIRREQRHVLGDQVPGAPVGNREGSEVAGDRKPESLQQVGLGDVSPARDGSDHPPVGKQALMDAPLGLQRCRQCAGGIHLGLV